MPEERAFYNDHFGCLADGRVVVLLWSCSGIDMS